ncbi:unnamed protein product [Oikopleura dioica]|uniref:Uncharacterized protein n=1 Tax=Oikopleura dioica TaxID=34765 RepID=E4Y4I0_OIKDI|nr:unnamed protein product [Oikopleura dioica]
MKSFVIVFAVAASRVIYEGSGEELKSVWAPIRVKTPAKTRSDFEKFQAKMANLRENESVKAIENSIKNDLESGLRKAQEKMEIKSEALEASNPMEPIARTGIDLFNGLIDDIIVSFNKD